MNTFHVTKANQPRRLSGLWLVPILLLVMSLAGQPHNADPESTLDSFAVNLVAVDLSQVPETLDEPDHDVIRVGESALVRHGVASASLGQASRSAADAILAFIARAPPVFNHV